MEIEVDEDLVIADEDTVEEVNNTEEAVENSEVSENEDPEINQDDEDEEDRIVTIGDSEPESDESGDETTETPGWVKTVRKSNRKLASENKKLKRLLEEKEKSAENEKPVELGEKPTLKGCNYDDSVYEKEVDSYLERKRKVEKQAAEKAKIVEEQNKIWQNRQEQYSNLKKEHSFKDYDEAEELVSGTLTKAQQSIIVQGAEDAALVVYALGKNPKKLEELSKISNPVDFAFTAAKLESQLKVISKKAPAPEKRVKTGKSGGITGTADKTLERLREEAAKTGNYTKVREYKTKLRNKG